jgi:hypothetical protein
MALEEDWTSRPSGLEQQEGLGETAMFNEFHRIATAAVGALVFTVFTVGAAVAPAQSVHSELATAAQSHVADRANV